jgi:hypothetical protein
MNIQRIFLILLILAPINILSETYQGAISINNSWSNFNKTIGKVGFGFHPMCSGYMSIINGIESSEYNWDILLYVKIELCNQAISRLLQQGSRHYQGDNFFCGLCHCCKDYLVDYLPLILFQNEDGSFKTEATITIITTYLDTWELTLDESFVNLASLYEAFLQRPACAIQ